ncbi:YciI family protein [Pokkaliibacter sp. MBI-7]|uniref:YciI family protein n=1 Tax=Pokkaliibacter sp. MBI-7 TaxID=3040600 RepID=UPI0024482570|nr:YciI family protein [Pokkaliibacter sp. MBI-7]MDH2431690.1 YciI family protein [Pokkaliibacter sp. MBI-7]
MFVVTLNYVCDLSEVDAVLAEHVEYLRQQYAAGVFLVSGRLVPRTGGVILAKAESRQALQDVLAQDPFARLGLAQYTLMEFVPSMTAPGLEHLLP